MKIIKGFFCLLLISTIITSCSKDDEDTTIDPADPMITSFKITFTNTVNLLASHVFNTPDGAMNPAPIPNEGGSYSVSFTAVPGSKMSFVNMLANSNDWFFGLDQNGLELFDANGDALAGDITDKIKLYDAGTEEEDPTTIATEPDGGVNGAPDDDNTVRMEQEDVSNYLAATLSYENEMFTLKITKNADGILTPGIVVIHAQGNPLFTTGATDRGEGLKTLAESGNPAELSGFINEVGTDGNSLRLSAAMTPFAPGIVYAFESEDPFFTQGEIAKMDSGLKELAEDGNNQIAFDYLKGMDIPVAKSNEGGGVGPGGSLTFDIDVPEGYKLGIATMFVQSNDWIVAFNNNGASLFDASGNPTNGLNETMQLYLFDVGTEADEEVGFGANQPMRQAMAGSGNADPDATVRRVKEINNVQFSRGTLSSETGVVSLHDVRGGYNVGQALIEPK